MNFPIDIIKTSGSHYQIGYDIGKKCYKYIINLYNAYYKKLDIAKYNEYKNISNKYLKSIKKLYPQYYDEIRGISDGSSIDIEKICLLMFDEISQIKLGCTDIIARRNATKHGTTIVMHTNDLEKIIFDYIVLIYMKPDDEPEILGVSVAGLVFSTAINAHMLCFTGNEVTSNDVKYSGIPRNIIYRALIASKSLEKSIFTCIDKNRASSYNNIITSNDGTILNIEGSATDYDFIEPINDVLIHTNHYISDKMLKYEKEAIELNNNTKLRLLRANYLVKQKYGTLNLRSMIQFSMDKGWFKHPSSAICKTGSEIYTIFSFIIEMETRTIILGIGGETCKKMFYRLPVPIHK